MKSGQKTMEVNLRHQSSGYDLQRNIESRLDSVFYPILQKTVKKYPATKKSNYEYIGIQVRLIVGKGLNSRTHINGKHPVRFYTEQYLTKLGLSWREADYWSGQEGVLLVDL